MKDMQKSETTRILSAHFRWREEQVEGMLGDEKSV